MEVYDCTVPVLYVRLSKRRMPQICTGNRNLFTPSLGVIFRSTFGDTASLENIFDLSYYDTPLHPKNTHKTLGTPGIKNMYNIPD